MNEPYEVADGAMRFDRMTEGLVGKDPVAVLAADPLPLEEPRLLEVGDDPLHRTFGDSHAGRHLAKHESGILRQQDQDVPVIGEHRPSAAGVGGGRLLLGRPGRARCGARTCGFLGGPAFKSSWAY